MLKATWTVLMKTRRCLVEMNLKLTAWTIGQTFQDPWQALKRSFLILFPMVAKESPFTNPRQAKKTLMKMGLFSKKRMKQSCVRLYPSCHVMPFIRPTKTIQFEFSRQRLNLPPEDLIDSNLQGNIFGFSSWDLLVKPVVEVVSGGSVVDETEEGKSQETLHVEGSSADEHLWLSENKNKSQGQQYSSGARFNDSIIIYLNVKWTART